MKRINIIVLWLFSILFFTLGIIPASFAESLKDSGGILMKDNASIFLKDGSKIQCNMVLWYYLKEDCIQCRQRTNVREFPIKDVDLSNTFDESIALEYDEMKNQLTKKYADSKTAREKNVIQHELDPAVKQLVIEREKRRTEIEIARKLRKAEEERQSAQIEAENEIAMNAQEAIEERLREKHEAEKEIAKKLQEAELKAFEERIEMEKKRLKKRLKYFYGECISTRDPCTEGHKKWCNHGANITRKRIDLLENDPKQYFYEKAERAARKQHKTVSKEEKQYRAERSTGTDSYDDGYDDAKSGDIEWGDSDDYIDGYEDGKRDRERWNK